MVIIFVLHLTCSIPECTRIVRRRDQREQEHNLLIIIIIIIIITNCS